MKKGSVFQLSVLLEIFVFCAMLVGVAKGAYNSPIHSQVFLYFTYLSNIFIGLICGWSAYCKINDKKFSTVMKKLKFIATVSILFTFTVFWLFLSWDYSADYLTGLVCTLLHTLIPLAAIADFLFDRYSITPTRKLVYQSLISPIAYVAVVMFIWYPAGVTFNEYGKKFPYFFLDFNKYGWFTINTQAHIYGVVYWIILLFVFFVILAYSLNWARKFIERVKLNKF